MSATRVVIYGRTSLDKSEGRSVDDQLAELRRWARDTGRHVVAELRDDGIGASRHGGRKSRPDWQRAMELIAAREVDELGVWELSRSTRDRAVWAALIASCIEATVNLAVNGKVHDPTDPDDGFMLDLGAALAVREAAVIAKRTARGSRSRAAQGRPHGALNYGYRIEHDVATGAPLRRVHDPAEVAVIREIVDRLLSAESASTIARDLTARGIPGPRDGAGWHGSNLTRLVQAPALAGLRVHRGQVLEGVTASWKPILTVDEHRRLVSMLNDPARRSSRTGSHVRHLLPGVAECGICGGPVRALTRKRATDTVVTYNCRANYCFSRIAWEVDDLVERVIVERLSRPDLIGLLNAGDPAAVEASDEVARLKAKLGEARRLVAADRLSLASLVDLEARTLPQLAAAERAARPRHIPSIILDTAGPDAGKRWAVLPVVARREIVRTLAHVRIKRTGRRDGTIPFDPRSVEITPKLPGSLGRTGGEVVREAASPLGKFP